MSLIALSVRAALLTPASAAAHARYCGPNFILQEPGGYGASDFYVTNISCHDARHVANEWLHARIPHHLDGWTFRGGYTQTVTRGSSRFTFTLFGTD